MNKDKICFAAFSIIILMAICGQPLPAMQEEKPEPENREMPARPPHNWDIMNTVEFLSSDICEGRSAGTVGSFEAAAYIKGIFESTSLLPLFKDGYSQAFRIRTSSGEITGRNIAGIIPGNGHGKYEKPYIIVGAHYDHLGKLYDKVYPGADDNASGIAALGYIARQFAMNRFLMDTASRSVIFIAFDAKEYSMAGSRTFVDSLLSENGITDPSTGKRIRPDEIAFAANIDQIGSILEPIDSRHREYLMVLGSENLDEYGQNILAVTEKYLIPELKIGYDYYGSRKFTELFMRLSDQASFTDAGITALLFTSGINDHTYKVTDDISTVDPKALAMRARYIYLFLERLTR